MTDLGLSCSGGFQNHEAEWWRETAGGGKGCFVSFENVNALESSYMIQMQRQERIYAGKGPVLAVPLLP